MTKLSVPDIHCEKCVERITKALTAENLKFQVSPADKTVTVDGCEGCAAKAMAALEDLGFPATKI